MAVGSRLEGGLGPLASLLGFPRSPPILEHPSHTVTGDIWGGTPVSAPYDREPLPAFTHRELGHTELGRRHALQWFPWGPHLHPTRRGFDAPACLPLDNRV